MLSGIKSKHMSSQLPEQKDEAKKAAEVQTAFAEVITIIQKKTECKALTQDLINAMRRPESSESNMKNVLNIKVIALCRESKKSVEDYKDYSDKCKKLFSKFYPSCVGITQMQNAFDKLSENKSASTETKASIETKEIISQLSEIYFTELDNLQIVLTGRIIRWHLEDVATPTQLYIGQIFQSIRDQNLKKIMKGEVPIEEAKESDINNILAIYNHLQTCLEKLNTQLKGDHGFFETAMGDSYLDYLRQAKLNIGAILLAFFLVLQRSPIFLKKDERVISLVKSQNKACLEEFISNAKRWSPDGGYEYQKLVNLYPEARDSYLTKPQIDFNINEFERKQAIKLLELGIMNFKLHNEAKGQACFDQLMKMIKYNKGDAPNRMQFEYVWSVYHAQYQFSIEPTKMKYQEEKHGFSKKTLERVQDLIDVICSTGHEALNPLINETNSFQKCFEELACRLLKEYQLFHKKEDQVSLEKALKALELYARCMARISCYQRSFLGVCQEFTDLREKLFPETISPELPISSFFDIACNKYAVLDKKLDAILQQKNKLKPTDAEMEAHIRSNEELVAKYKLEDERKLETQLHVAPEPVLTKKQKSQAKKKKKAAELKELEKQKLSAAKIKTESKEEVKEDLTDQAKIYHSANLAMSQKKFDEAKQLYEKAIRVAKESNDHITIAKSITEIAHSLLAKGTQTLKSIMKSLFKWDTSRIEEIKSVEKDYENAIFFAETALDYCASLADKDVCPKTIAYIQEKLSKPMQMILEDSQKELLKTQQIITNHKHEIKIRIAENLERREEAKRKMGPRWFNNKKVHGQERAILECLMNIDSAVNKIDSSLNKSTLLFLSPLNDLALIHTSAVQPKLEFIENSSTALVLKDQTIDLTEVSFQERLVLLAKQREARHKTFELTNNKLVLFQAGARKDVSDEKTSLLSQFKI